jgi:hypothetical protein
MRATERAIQWNAVDGVGALTGFDVALNRRQLLMLAGATAAGVTLAGPLAPGTSTGGSASGATAAASAVVSLGSLTAAQFFGLLGEQFSFQTLDGERAGERGRLTLSNVSVPDPASVGQRPAGLRAHPFALLFTLEEGTLGPSAIARLEQESIGRIELFVQSVLPGDPANPRLYEAVFN